MKTILLVEDDRMVSHLIKSFLEKSEFSVQQVFHGELVKQAITEHQPELVILDLGLPQVDGLHLCQELRKIYHQPIIVLTAREADEDQILAFEFGADDFISKPVAPKVLKVRIEAMIRRLPAHKPAAITQYNVGNLVLYPQAHKCEVNQQVIRLSSFEFRLLVLLAENLGQVMTREVIYSTLLNRPYNGSERTIDVRISKLRDKLLTQGLLGVSIDTIWGKGYSLIQLEKTAADNAQQPVTTGTIGVGLS
ncbi:two-component system, OmpR family, response regulator VicR [Colwellia chukchiensis]|uniref:Two-component system, OmpR family, response regulator VicR n=1 Tax=Colwellia chukchiensis TaxID=641665 RepID=A0A1H7I075_9GAMM|nr:response regulator transcription factor [Colwellia chukchiensis]SEK55889.1 two-component system, OmpR family, response regulator VicR [Colwellia chukchiensis]